MTPVEMVQSFGLAFHDAGSCSRNFCVPQVSKVGKKPGCLGYIGDFILPSCAKMIINHDIRIPIIKQPVFHGK